MTTPSYRSEAHAGDIASTPTVAKPAGVVVGDVLVAIVCYQGATLADGPAGWTSLSSLTGTGGFVSSRVFTRTVDGTEGSSFTFGNPESGVEAACIVAIADATVTGLAFDKLEGSGGSTSMSSPSVTASNPSSMLVFLGAHGFDLATATPPGGLTERVDFGVTSALVNRSVYAATVVQSAAGATGTKTATLSGSGTYGAHGWMVVLSPSNLPPNAPSLITPVGGVSVDKDTANVFRWSFSDPDTGDSQSAYELRYQIVGAGSWTSTGQITSPNGQRTIAAATFTEDDYEWQVRTWDSQGEVGDWSSSGFFTAATVPADLTITAPTSGSVLSTSQQLVEWSTPDQTAYQVRRVGDSGGSPDTGTVYFDTGEVTSTNRSLTVSFPTNNQDEHIQVRKKSAGLWSDWVSVAVSVAYTTPLAPSVTVAVYQVDGVDAALQITVGNP